MPADLARSAWELAPLSAEEWGPHARFPRLGNTEKLALWDAYRAGSAARVPVTLWVNNRICLLDPRFNPDGLRYEQVFAEPEAMLIAQLRMNYILRMRHHLFCDQPTGLPERWEVGAHFQNVYEAAAFGAPIEFKDNDVPGTRPIFDDDNKHAIFDVNIDEPLQLGVSKIGVEMTHQMRDIARGKTFFGRPIDVVPYTELGSDGPLTVAMNLRGGAILTDMLREPEHVRQLFDLIVTAGLKRRAAFLDYWGLPEPEEVWFADDSITMISVEQCRQFVLPHHRMWFDTADPQRTRRRTMHLCGDATRHFKTIVDELGVVSFDTGFPVDFGRLRRELGPVIEILGGVEIPLLLSGSPEDVYRRAERILKSGVLEGRRFILRDANNLPPGASWANLAAMYQAAFDFGRHE